MIGLLFIWFLTPAYLVDLNTNCPLCLIKPDSVTIISEGTNNTLMVDSIPVNTELSKDYPLNITGKIFQTGNSNNIEILTPEKSGKNQNEKQQQIKISQSGNNNSVKINTQ